MNIFVLDYDIRKCAEMHKNKHIVKMPLETAQMLCSVHHVISEREDIPYKLAHKNHPCSIWARECAENYLWLCGLGIELCREYTKRYKKLHKCQEVIEWAILNMPTNLIVNGGITPHALAMPNECKIGDAVESYREYYRVYKKHLT